MDLNTMCVDDIENLQKLIEFKNEAKRLYDILNKKQKIYLFPDERGRFVTWKDDYNSEYLIQKDGQWWWIAAYLHQHYEVPISADGIYQMMKRGYEWSINPEKRGYVNNDKDAIRYFTSYVDYTLNKQ